MGKPNIEENTHTRIKLTNRNIQLVEPKWTICFHHSTKNTEMQRNKWIKIYNILFVEFGCLNSEKMVFHHSSDELSLRWLMSWIIFNSANQPVNQPNQIWILMSCVQSTILILRLCQNLSEYVNDAAWLCFA